MNGTFERCKERPWEGSNYRCIRPKGHSGEHVDSKIKRFAWPNKNEEKQDA